VSTLERAISIAAEAHAGQRDKAGEPYILHPLRVMLAVKTPEEQMAAALHDVVEDTPLTVEQLRDFGFPDAVVDAVDALTRREGEDYFDFVRRAAANPVARPVKLADLRDNLKLSRIPAPSQRDHDRIARYRAALQMLGEDEEAPESPGA
jgi:(p)ppGpp synthase/HD superfamily hydrolase